MNKFCLYLLLLIGCSQPNLAPPSANNSMIKEDFNDFFDKFSKDTLFQKDRIDVPLPVIFSDNEEDSLQNIVVEKVSFDAKEWKHEVEISKAMVSNDTFKVTLQALDTGIFVEHYFVLRDGVWRLFEIKDLSD